MTPGPRFGKRRPLLPQKRSRNKLTPTGYDDGNSGEHRQVAGAIAPRPASRGPSGEWARQPITLYSRNTLSGTYEYFRETALYGGEYRPEIKQQPDSDAVVQSIRVDKFGIGYSGIGFKAEGVRAAPLAAYYGGTSYEASLEPTLSGKYPIARYLYIYLNKKPNQSLEPLRAEFVKYILSKNGQEQTERGGFFSISNEIRESDLSKLGISPGS